MERRLELAALDELVRAPRNPKRHDLSALGASIDRFGYVEPIVVDERTGRIVAGHGRLEDLSQRRSAGEEAPDGVSVIDGRWQVPVLRGWSSRSDAEAEAYLVASNRIGELGGWDQAALAELLGELAEASPEALGGTGYDPEALAALNAEVADAQRPPLTGDPDEAPPEPAVARTQPGDLWLAGPHRILCGDSRRAEDMDRVLDGAPADAVFTDPPYGVDYVGKTSAKLKVQSDDLDPDQLAEFLRTTLGNARAHTKGGGAWYVCGPAGPPSHAFGTVLLELGVWRRTICWVKDSMVLGRGDYHYRHEVISVGDVADPDAAPDPDLGPSSVFYGWAPGASHRRVANRSQTSVWEFPRPKASREHPTIKPVALVAKAIENSTRAGDVVLDPFGGSGSTALAAHSLARRAALIETHPPYVDVICRRLRDIAGLEVRHENGAVWAPVE